MTRRAPPSGGRAVSTTLGYTLTLAISTLLVAGLIVTGGNFVSTQREIVIENELEVIGEQVAGQLEQADRLVTASAGGTSQLRLVRQFPDMAAGETYDISLESGGAGSTEQLVLETNNPDIRVTVDVALNSAWNPTTASGGSVRVRWTGSALEVDNG